MDSFVWRRSYWKGTEMIYSAHGMIDAILTTHFDERDEATIRLGLIDLHETAADYAGAGSVRRAMVRWAGWRGRRLRTSAG